MPETNPFDPARLAMSLKETEGNVAQLQQQLTNATQNLGSAMQSIQVDIRSITNKMDNVTLVAAKQENMEDEIVRAFNAIKELADTSKEKWEEHHSTEKQDKEKRDLEIRNSREKLILWGGVIGGFSVLASILTAIVAWSVNSRFDNQARDHDKLDARLDMHIVESAKEHNLVEEKVEKIEKFLIRSGEPYDGEHK